MEHVLFKSWDLTICEHIVETARITYTIRMVKIALIEPEIPQNTGTIARLCAATNSQLVLVGKLGFSLDDKYLKRAGLDYWEYVNWTHVESVSDYIESMMPNEQVWALSTKGTTSYTDVSYTTDMTLMFGSESKGLSDAIRARYQKQLITIPMANPNIRSLNLANAVSIVLYEGLRQII